jgi:hypothetical protein
MNDRIARVLGALGFLLSIFTFYFAFWRPPCLQIGIGPQIFIAAKPRVGVLTTLVNDGAHEVIITSGKLQLDNSRFTLPLTISALQSESWEYDIEGNHQNPTSVRYSFFTPFAIKPHDQASASLWFVSIDGFPLNAGKHTAVMVLEEANGQSISLQFEIELKQPDLTALYEKKKGKEQAGIEYPVNIISQTTTNTCPLF